MDMTGVPGCLRGAPDNRMPKAKLKVKVTLEQATKAQRGSRCRCLLNSSQRTGGGSMCNRDGGVPLSA